MQEVEKIITKTTINKAKYKYVLALFFHFLTYMSEGCRHFLGSVSYPIKKLLHVFSIFTSIQYSFLRKT